MITKFGSLYAGNLDMDDIGLAGTPVNDRSFSDDELVGVFPKAEAIATTLDRLGYDDFWAAEHHFQPEGYECIPNLLMLFVHLAHLTENLRFGCGFNINPMWHPLRLAEDYATADILTGGRVIFGVGRGYHSREVESFGNPIIDQDANRELFEEQVEVMMKAFHQRSFSHHGKHYDIPPHVPYRGYELEEITLVPRPRNLPVECWQPMVSASQRGLDFMARHGIKGIIGGGAAPGGAGEEVVKRWQETLASHGKETELGGDLAIGINFHIAETEQQAIENVRDIFHENMKMFAPLIGHDLDDDQIEVLADPHRAPNAGLPTVEDAIRGGSWIVGPPELVTEKLMSLQDRWPGLERIHVNVTPMGTPLSMTLEQLELFATEVMPTFKNQQDQDPVSAD